MSDFRLKVFRAAARHLSLTKAADVMCISQPAVTRHIKEIESEYGLRVFERANGKLTLTPAGRTLLEHAEKILEQYDALDYDMTRLKGSCGGHLRLGASTTISQYMLPGLLSGFVTRYPDVHLLLVSGNTADIEQALIRHDIDLGLVEGLSHQSSLRYTPWLQDELVAVVRADSRYAATESLTVDDLTHIPLVLREPGSGTLAVWQSALAQHRLSPGSLQVIAQLGSFEAIKQFISNYDAMAILSIRAVRRELWEGRLKLIELKDLPLKRLFHIVQRQGQENSLSEDFLRYLHSCEHAL